MRKYLIIMTAAAMMAAGCTNEEPNPEGVVQPPVPVPGEGETPVYVPEALPEFAYTIAPYGGERATDEVAYPAQDNKLNPMLTEWQHTVTVTYSGATATVTGAAEAGVRAQSAGANVNLTLPEEGFVRIVATGSSAEGSLRIAGLRKHLLELDNLTLTSTDRPAINDQADARVFLMLKGESRICDAPTYAPSGEDRKGCFFSEAHVVLCGDGVLVVEGKYRHGFATDGFLFVNPGATLAVVNAAKNGIHVKGSKSDSNAYRGIEITGGYVYANTSAPAGKAMKCDRDVLLRGGEVSLNCSGNPAIDPEDNTLSSAACVKTDMSTVISGGRISMCATGNGAKGIKADGNVTVNGAMTAIALSGDAISDQGDSSTPKAVKADGILTIKAGRLDFSAKGAGATGLEANGGISQTGGIVYGFGRKYGIFSAAPIAVTGGIAVIGGEENQAIGSTYDLTGLAADQVTRIHDEAGETVTCAFRWPVVMERAKLNVRL